MERVHPAQLVITDQYDTQMIRPLVATAGDPIACKEWDLGSPEIRVTATPRAGADGTEESGGYLGSRTVTLDLNILGDPRDKVDGHDAYYYADRLTAFCHPSRKPVLQITRPTGDGLGSTWSLPIRGNQFSISYGRRAAALLELQLTFVAPDSVLEGELKGPYSTLDVHPVASTDWRFPAHFTKGFGHGNPVYPQVTLNVGGSSAVTPILYIFGPVTNPAVYTDDGEKFAFNDLTLVSGQAVQIDMATGQLRIVDPGTNTAVAQARLFSAVDFSVSTFWRWQPGIHVLHYQGSGGSLSVQYRERRLTI